MLVGIKERFAIEAEPDSFINAWILGRFRFWIGGCEVGDWDDTADLKGCHAWLRDFEQNPRERYEPSLSDLSAAEVFSKVFDPVMPGGISHPDQLPIKNSACWRTPERSERTALTLIAPDRPWAHTAGAASVRLR